LKHGAYTFVIISYDYDYINVTQFTYLATIIVNYWQRRLRNANRLLKALGFEFLVDFVL